MPVHTWMVLIGCSGLQRRNEVGGSVYWGRFQDLDWGGHMYQNSYVLKFICLNGILKE